MSDTANERIHPAPSEFTPQQLAEEAILRFFHYGHLPARMQQISRPYCGLAKLLVTTVPRSAERTVALRKLLESKDAAVRAGLPSQA